MLKSIFCRPCEGILRIVIVDVNVVFIEQRVHRPRVRVEHRAHLLNLFVLSALRLGWKLQLCALGLFLAFLLGFCLFRRARGFPLLHGNIGNVLVEQLLTDSVHELLPTPVFRVQHQDALFEMPVVCVNQGYQCEGGLLWGHVELHF